MTEKAYANWVKRVIHKGIEWTHKHNRRMRVVIHKQTTPMHPAAEYFIFHTHPAPNGNVVVQYPEGARTLKTATVKAEVHLRHWNDPAKWEKDEDYGRMTNKP